MTTIKVKGNFSRLRSRIIKKDKGFNKFLLSTAFLLNSKIQRRVQQRGFGVKGKMPLYKSKAYRSFRRKRGREITKRDLTFTGRMWQSVSAIIRTSRKQAIMFFGGVEENRKAFFNDKRTPFFGLNSSEKAFLDKRLKDFGKL